MVTEQEMIQFENEIAEMFNNKQIKSPVHLYYSNEKQMLKIFEWVFCCHSERLSAN